MTNIQAIKEALKTMEDVHKKLLDKKAALSCPFIDNIFMRPIHHVSNAINELKAEVGKADFYTKEIKK